MPISLENVKAMLRPVAKKWKEIGDALEIRDHILDEVDTNNATDECCMDNAVEFWVTYHGPSWEKLATVLRGVGEETLANKCQGKGIHLLLHVFACVCGYQMLFIQSLYVFVYDYMFCMFLESTHSIELPA